MGRAPEWMAGMRLFERLRWGGKALGGLAGVYIFGRLAFRGRFHDLLAVVRIFGKLRLGCRLWAYSEDQTMLVRLRGWVVNYSIYSCLLDWMVVKENAVG